jgi:hypothetical protein
MNFPRSSQSLRGTALHSIVYCKVIISVLVEEQAPGEKREQLGCIQYQRSDQRTRQPTVQMSMVDRKQRARCTHLRRNPSIDPERLRY